MTTRSERNWSLESAIPSNSIYICHTHIFGISRPLSVSTGGTCADVSYPAGRADLEAPIERVAGYDIHFPLAWDEFMVPAQAELHIQHEILMILYIKTTAYKGQLSYSTA